MDSLKEYLRSKYFSHFGYVVAVLHVPALVLFAAVTGQLRTSERRTFRCDVADCRDDCLKKYDEQYNSPLPLYAFALLSFVPTPLVCIAYSWCCVKSQVDEIEAIIKPDPENPGPRRRVKTRRVFYCYFLHLLVRFFLGISFAVLQNSVFYVSGFPTEFACYVCGSTAILKPTANSTNLNVTNIDPFAINCDNSVGSDNATWSIGICIVNILFAFLVFGELCYLSARALKSYPFTLDSEFCLKHFFHQRRAPIGLPDSIFRFKSRVREETEYVEPLIASDDESNDRQTLDDIFVDLVIFTERAEHRFHYSLERHEIYAIYLQPKQGSVPIKKLAELFLPNKDTEDPRRILIVGCPAIGKSLLCKKILRDWSNDKLLFANSTKTFEYSFLFQFKWFNSGTEEEKKISLKQLLCRLYSDKQIDDDIFQHILDNPERVLLVFDGLDEFQHHDSCLEDEQAQSGNGPTEEMHFSALYVKLMKGLQLRGATVVTTCRPNVVESLARLTFERRVEIMGFTPEKVKEYVYKFCARVDGSDSENKDNTETKDRMWKCLSSNSELLSLCYIPVNSYIICSYLKEWINCNEQESESKFPATITEVFTGALKMFILKHHPEHKTRPLTKKDLTGIAPFPKSVEKTLDQLRIGSLALDGVASRQLLFESTQVMGMENCGLLKPLPDSKVSLYHYEESYCFIHLTIQELLAARELIAKSSPSELCNFISSNALDPKWQLVIQFVAGLLRGQKNEAVNSFLSLLHGALSADKYAAEGVNKKMALLMLKCLYEYNDEAFVKNAASELHKNSKFSCKIDLSACQVTSIECKAISYFVKHLIEVTVLNLGSNSITDQGILHLCESLKHENCKLTQLDLTINKIRDQGILHLCESLKHENCKLGLLYLSGNIITDQGILHLCESLKHENCKLTQLGLGCNGIGDQGILHLCESLKHENCKLGQLHLSGNIITDQGILHLCESLKHENCKLGQLHLSGNIITDQGILHLCESLKHENCKLTQLGLGYNSIGDQGILHLCESLKHENCKLTQLGLSGNNITDQGILHLCESLKHENCKLGQLHLSGNIITDQGILHLCESLKHENCKLGQLHLSGNIITDQGILHLCESLKHKNCKLTQFGLGYNSIGDQGILHLCESLKHENCKLTQLNLGGNNITDQGILHLCESLKHENCKLTQLDLSYNKDITEQGIKQLLETQRNNTQCEVIFAMF